ncbi:hypothetical protein [Alteromonas sp. ASW11-130]|uniref:hypothetical protein n=1 Tax=Alteromonas sp. ASW11-130 TaxID=3015775 RepID=UPI00224231ED|nr:hypothetical protein [Alteromonas sp. ASW11-130]MCW8091759.1 hypothetical protein [Alteromonas sp. ASW11-130]
MNTKKAGGLSALYAGCAYIFGFAVLLLFLSPEHAEGWSREQHLAFLLDNNTLVHIWNSVIYTVFGIALIFLTLALDARIAPTQSIFKSTAKILGFIWAGLLIASGMIANVGMGKVATLVTSEPDMAIQLWQTLGVIQDGLGGGVEVIGGLWVFMLSIIALKTGIFPKIFNWFGLIVGTAGLITILPGLGQFGAIFGLGQIVWFLWLSGLFFKESPEAIGNG